jgi:geranylgeranyl pyrophosphate synthase
MIEKKATEIALNYLLHQDFPQLIKWFTVNRVDMIKAGCLAVGGEISNLSEAITAVCCIHMGIKIIDDLIDEDQRGIQAEVGVGQAANAAYIYQATGIKIILDSNYSYDQKMKVIDYLIHFSKITSIGQYYDATQISTINNFYHALELKSGPLFGDCMRIGAVVSNATEEETQTLYQLGVIYGYLIQLNDDLSDTFATPASNDWLPNRTNLPLLYASNLPHEKQIRFNQIRNQVFDSETMLAEAQQILISSGAYFKVIEDIIWQSHLFRELLEKSSLKNKQPLEELFIELMDPVIKKINKLKLTFDYQELESWVINRRRQNA